MSQKLPPLQPGTIYRISSGLTMPERGRFIRWRRRYCSMHGDPLGWVAEFRKVRASGKESHLFDAPPTCHFEKEAT